MDVCRIGWSLYHISPSRHPRSVPCKGAAKVRTISLNKHAIREAAETAMCHLIFHKRETNLRKKVQTVYRTCLYYSNESKLTRCWRPTSESEVVKVPQAWFVPSDVVAGAILSLDRCYNDDWSCLQCFILYDEQTSTNINSHLTKNVRPNDAIFGELTGVKPSIWGESHICWKGNESRNGRNMFSRQTEERVMSFKY